MTVRKKQRSTASKRIPMVVIAVLVTLCFFTLSGCGKDSGRVEEENVVLTNAQIIANTDLETNYPANEREVVNMYGRIMQVLYNETYDEKELEVLAAQLQLLYDNELLLNQPNYVLQLKQEINQKKNDGFQIQNYVVPGKNDVTFFTQDGRECAGMDVQFSVRNPSRMEATFYIFILRKDVTTGRWKIFGWQPKEDQSFNLFGDAR